MYYRTTSAHCEINIISYISVFTSYYIIWHDKEAKSCETPHFGLGPFIYTRISIRKVLDEYYTIVYSASIVF